MEYASERRKSGQIVQQFLAESLASGNYGPGAKLPTERALSEQLSIPRSAVRNALSRLEAQGRIIRVVGSGTYVAPEGSQPDAIMPLPVKAPVSDASPLEIMETRLLVEPKLAALVVIHANASDFLHMEECLRNAEAAESFETFEHWDGLLHQAIANATHNRLMINVYRTITTARDHAEWGNLKRKSITPERREAYQIQHRAIVAALRARDSAQAEAALSTHLRKVRQNLLGY